MSEPARLSMSVLDAAPGPASWPGYDPRELGTGIVHLGLGAFHRAHQAALTHRAPDLLEGSWGIVGVTQRSRRVVDQLRPQDGLFTVVERGPASLLQTSPPQAAVVGSIRQVLNGRSEAKAVVTALARPSTRIVSTTVTEKGYAADLATQRLDLGNTEVKEDLCASLPHRTVVGQLVAGFAARAERGHPGVTVICCDNVVRGGQLLRELCRDFLSQWVDPSADITQAWVDSNVSFPNTLVDRIVPATTARDRGTYARALGYRDEALVTAEPYSLWVIEDDFAAGRPAWPIEHVRMVPDVQPWSDLKLRLLNGAHSLLAYAGLERGMDTVSEATADAQVRSLLDAWMSEAAQSLEVIPTGIDVASYAEEVSERFDNPGIEYRLEQVSQDGSVKLPARVFPVAVAHVERGRSARVSAYCLGAWLRHVETVVSAGGRLADPAAASLQSALAASTLDARSTVEHVLGAGGVVPAPDQLQSGFLDDVAVELASLRRARK